MFVTQDSNQECVLTSTLKMAIQPADRLATFGIRGGATLSKKTRFAMESRRSLASFLGCLNDEIGGDMQLLELQNP